MTSTDRSRYHVPKHIQKHIDYITPGTNLFPSGTQRLSSGRNRKRETAPKNREHTLSSAHKPSHQAGDPGDLSSCDSVMTPACIKALYKVPPADKANSSNSMGIYSQFESYFQLSLNAFFAKFTPNIPQGTHPILASIDGGFAPGVFVNDSNPLELENPETALDLQVAYPLIYPQNIELFQVGPITTNLTVLTTLEIESTESLGLLNPFLDAIDGVSISLSACKSSRNLLTESHDSHTAHILPTVRLATTRLWIQPIRVPIQEDTMERYSAASSNPRMSFRFHTGLRNTFFQLTIKSASATSELSLPREL